MPVKILMVDGERGVLELAKSSISTVQWCELITIQDGREAAQLLHQQKFDGIVLADRLPHMDSFDLIQRLRDSKLNAGVPIVMLTGDDNINTMRRGFKVGVTFFAMKPTSRERFFHLFNAVHGAMENERRRHHRLPYRTPVKCTLLDQGNHHFMGESIEISEGGMSVRPSAGVAIGQALELEFLFPDVQPRATPTPIKSRKALFAEQEHRITGPQKIRATVRNLPNHGESMGMDFQGLTAKQRESIQLYIGGTN